MKKERTDNIIAVTVARTATMYIEADTPEEALEYAKEHCGDIDYIDFLKRNAEVEFCEAFPSQAEDYMEKIWVEDGNTMSYDEYMDELGEVEEE